MKLDCTVENYAELYARWLVEPGKLLDIAKLQPGERVIDLCGGTGIVAREAIARGAQTAFVVDLNPRFGREDWRMCPPFQGRAENVDYLLEEHIRVLHRVQAHDEAEKHPVGCLCHRYAPTFDLVVCRQAVNYLDISDAFRGVAAILRPGGRFAFNTFLKPPRIAFKRYTFNERRFFEASIHIRQRVFHLQASPGLGYDITKFYWQPEERLDAVLAKHGFMKVEKKRSEKGLTYVAWRS